MNPITRRTCLKRLALAATTPALAKAAESSLPAEQAATIARIARAAMVRGQIPGLSVAFAHKGQIVHTAGYGEADQKAGELVTPAHRFRIASVSKPITSAAIWSLIEAGKLALADAVFGSRGLLPSYASTAAAEKITIHHLLTHTCGGWGNQRNDPMFMRPDLGHNDLIDWTLREFPLTNEPGKSYAYSNFGYCLLGRVVEAVSGRSYAEFVQERILSKCGILNMRIARNGLGGRQPGEVVYYGRKNEDPYRPTMNVERMDAHGGWLATAEDLVRFLIHVDGFGDLPDLLQPGSIKSMTTPTAVNPGYACGWSVNPQPNWWHGGSLPGTSTLAVRTAGGMCWAALANTRVRDANDPMAGTGLLLDRLMWQLARSVPEWQA